MFFEAKDFVTVIWIFEVFCFGHSSFKKRVQRGPVAKPGVDRCLQRSHFLPALVGPSDFFVGTPSAVAGSFRENLGKKKEDRNKEK